MIWTIILLAVLVMPVMGTMGPALVNVNIPGNDINNGWTDIQPDAQACAAECDANSNCYAVTYVLPATIQGPDGHCWLKSSQSATTFQETNFNTTSFVKIIPMSCVIIPGWKADFSATLTTGKAPLTVSFTDTSSYGSSDWYWSFGDPCTAGCTDGGVSTQKNPVHIYQTPGTYDVELIVKDNCGAFTKAKKTSFIMVDAGPSMGSLDITSSPSGARIFIDGVYQGTTPLLGKDLTVGSHDINLTLSGYQDYSKTQKIYNGVILQFAATMTKTIIAPTGSLQITTTPGGAVVFIDGGSGGTTPVFLSNLAVGSHTVKLTKSGYAIYEAPVTINAGQTTPLNINLVVAGTGPTSTTPTPTPNTGTTGSLAIISSPAGARVNLDGQDQGITPVTIQNVKAGSHTVTLYKSGYNDYPATVTVKAGSTSQITISLTGQTTDPTPSTPGTLTIRSTPVGANVYIDGETAGITPVKIQNVKVGTHKILLTLKGYSDNSQTIEITAGSDKELSVDFGKPALGFSLPVSLAALACTALVVLWKKKDR